MTKGIKTGIVKVLLKHGVDKSIRYNYGATAWETVAGLFEQSKPIYGQIDSALQPLGLKLDFAYLEETRSQIAEMLK